MNVNLVHMSVNISVTILMAPMSADVRVDTVLIMILTHALVSELHGQLQFNV